MTELGISIEVKPLQKEKAEFPIEMTEFGIYEFLHPVCNVFVAVSIMALQLSLESYFVFPLSTVILSKPLHSENAKPAIWVTELGISTAVKPLQP